MAHPPPYRTPLLPFGTLLSFFFSPLDRFVGDCSCRPEIQAWIQPSSTLPPHQSLLQCKRSSHLSSTSTWLRDTLPTPTWLGPTLLIPPAPARSGTPPRPPAQTWTSRTLGDLTGRFDAPHGHAGPPSPGSRHLQCRAGAHCKARDHFAGLCKPNLGPGEHPGPPRGLSRTPRSPASSPRTAGSPT